MKDILFFDAKCPVCAKEIKLLNKLKKDTLELVNIHSDQVDDLIDNKTQTELLSFLHLKSSSKGWVTGVDASVIAWSHTPIGWAFKPLRWPLIKPIVDKIYARWAINRACNLSYITK